MDCWPSLSNLNRCENCSQSPMIQSSQSSLSMTTAPNCPDSDLHSDNPHLPDNLHIQDTSIQNVYRGNLSSTASPGAVGDGASVYHAQSFIYKEINPLETKHFSKFPQEMVV